MVCFTLEWALKIDSEEYLRGLWAERGGGAGGGGLVEAEAACHLQVTCASLLNKRQQAVLIMLRVL